MAHIFTGYLLGVEPSELAYENYTVMPVMCQKVNRAKGIVPTKKGDIVTSWTREKTKFTHHLVSPPKTRVTIALPVEGLEAYRVTVNGQRPADGIKGVGNIDSDDRYLYLRDAAPGSYTSVITAEKGSYATPTKRADSKSQRTKQKPWRLNAASSHEGGGFGLQKVIDEITTSRRSSKGYSCDASASADSKTWLEIDFREQKAIKTITLYPRTDAKSDSGMTAGFPVDLSVSVKKGDGAYTVVKKLTDIPNPKGNPYKIDLYTVVGYPEATSIRIDVTKRGQPAADEPGAYRLQLAEVKVAFVE